MTGFIKHFMRLENRPIVFNETIDLEDENFTCVSFQVIGSTPINIDGRPWTASDGIYSIQLEAPNVLTGKVSIKFDNDVHKNVIMTTMRLIDSVYMEVTKVCKK